MNSWWKHGKQFAVTSNQEETNKPVIQITKIFPYLKKEHKEIQVSSIS